MSLHDLINGIVARRGILAAIFMDAQGEVILSSGDEEPEKLHLIGAYQAIVLATAARLGLKPNRTIFTICQSCSILTHHLKDGYFISVVFSPAENHHYVHFQLQETYRQFMEEL